MSLFTPNTDFYSNYYDKERYLLVWRTSLIFASVFFVLLVIFFYLKSTAILPISITFIIAVMSTIYLYTSKNFKALYWVYAITGTLISNLAMNYVMTSTHYVDFIWMLTCVLIAFIGLGRKIGYAFILINIIGAIYYYFFTLNTLLVTITPKTNLGLFVELLELIFAFFVLTYLMSKFSEFQKMSEEELVIANKKSEVKTNENKYLIKEIHHRVKNNLQIIISLLRLQRNEIKSEEAKTHFSEAINRIMVMSLIHQKLYKDKSLAEVKITDYLSELTNDLISISAKPDTIDIQIESNIEQIGLETIVPLGLLINELVSNSVQHAFNGKKGIIKISIKKKVNDFFILNYSDSGKWNKPEKDYSSFGLELIGILAAQLDGDFKRESSVKGTQYIFNLKDID